METGRGDAAATTWIFRGGDGRNGVSHEKIFDAVAGTVFQPVSVITTGRSAAPTTAVSFL